MSELDESADKSGPAISANRLLRMEIRGFRGFNRPQSFDFDASAVLLGGGNGSGKTSVFDALQWLMVGSIPRLDRWRLRKGDEYLVNAYTQGKGAQVEAEFRIEERPIKAIRRGTANLSHLEVIDDAGHHVMPEAELVLAGHLAPGELPLKDVLHTSGLLQQDDLRQILQTKPDARYRQLMRLLGLESVEVFERMTTASRTTAREQTREALRAVERARHAEGAAREVLDTSELQAQRVSDAVDITSRVAALLAASSQTLRFVEPERFAGNLAQGADDAARLSRAASTFLATESRLPAALPIVAPDELPAAQRTADTTVAALEASNAQVAAATATLAAAVSLQDVVGRLASAALPLLPTDAAEAPCPVCGTVIRPDAVIASLRARASGTEAVLTAQGSLDLARDISNRAQVEHAQALARLADMNARVLVRQDCLATWRQVVAAAKDLTGGTMFEVAEAVDLAGPDGLSAVDQASAFQQLRDGRGQLRHAVSALGVASDRLATDVRALLQDQSVTRLAAERSSAVPRNREFLANAVETRVALEAAYEDARRAEQAANSLAEASSSGAIAIFRERFAALEPLMNDVYGRLDPHPSFRHLSFSVESFRAKGTATAIVRDEERDIALNPMLIFSSAQANIVVLAAFLALGWAAGNGSLPFVLLDDPLQALDDVNVLGFADLARHIRRERQLVVATHEQRFAGLLERKLWGNRAEEDLIVHEFVGWSRSGPEIETRHITARTTPALILDSNVA